MARLRHWMYTNLPKLCKYTSKLVLVKYYIILQKYDWIFDANVVFLSVAINLFIVDEIVSFRFYDFLMML